MKIKRYEGEYVHDLIAQVRSELGPDAVVLHTRWRNGSGLKRLLGRPSVEVWAGVNDGSAAGTPEPEPPQAPVIPLDPPGVRLLALRQALQANGAPVEVVAEPAPLPAASESPSREELTVALFGEFNAVLERIEAKVDQLQPPPPASDPIAPREQALLDAGVEPEVAKAIHAAAQGRTVAEVLHDTFLCPTELRLTGNPRVIALVGPSGAGKTTTAAKLAGHLSLARGARVVLISTDVHRIGAFPQLQALGELMQVPVLTALTPSDALAKVRQARREHDVVIIDTPACSGPGPVWESLLDTLIAVEPEELLLTLAANTKPSDVQRTARHYGATLPLGGVVVTKLDESGDPGILVNVAWRFQTPVVWLGTGPDIPADLEAATPQQLVNRVWSTRLAAHAEVGS